MVGDRRTQQTETDGIDVAHVATHVPDGYICSVLCGSFHLDTCNFYLTHVHSKLPFWLITHVHHVVLITPLLQKLHHTGASDSVAV